jgi:hypothetical protein
MRSRDRLRRCRTPPDPEATLLGHGRRGRKSGAPSLAGARGRALGHHSPADDAATGDGSGDFSVGGEASIRSSMNRLMSWARPETPALR